MIALWMSTVAVLAASPCEPGDGGLAVGPVAASLWDGDLGRAHRICPRSEVSIGPRALLLVDTPAFYGQIVVAGQIDASIAASERTELWLRLEPVRFQNVISAIPASSFGYGFTGLGLSHRLDAGGPSAVAFVGQLVLPSAIGLQGNSYPFGLNAAVAFDHLYSERWSSHGQLGYVWSAALTHGPSQLRSGYFGTAGAVYTAGRAFSFVLDAQAAIAYSAVLDHLAAAPGVRFAAGPWGLDLGVVVPVVGRDRTLVATELHSTVRF